MPALAPCERQFVTRGRFLHNAFTMELNCLTVPQWQNYQGLLHGFLGRRGGKSAGPYAGLNLSFRVGDEAQVVKDNICDMKKAVGIHDARIVTMRQVHGDEIVEVKDKNLKEAGEADGMFTGEREVYLGVLTADCVPILFVAPEKKIAAAVHAGWRGTLAGIAAKMVGILKTKYGVGSDGIEAALGPAIGACCYEIKEDVSRPLAEKWGRLAEAALYNRDGKTFVDLRSLNRAILEDAGVPSNRIYQLGPCTSCAKDEFFSYRRERKETGRQISFIGWTAPAVSSSGSRVSS
ncbi:MAG TPA: peptidoglycan editing factor PgeF [Candidatus Binatia bacterium]|nr:peptidoglycan editing factor PgeF [Candidatus Binatia bacterium]